MSAQQMVEKLTKLGGRTSGFEQGKTRRGLLGRGAKDVTEFGPVTFESIRDGQYALCRIEPSTQFRIETGAADEAIREGLGLRRGNGTVVTLEVRARFQIPPHSTMLEKFARYCSLRDIFSNDRREITLVDLGRRDPHEDRLAYHYPSLPPCLDTTFPVPGYSAVAHLTILRHPQPFEEDKHGANKPYRNGGLLVKSAAAIHDVTLFSFENDPYAACLSGVLRCDHIDDLVRQFDELEGASPDNALHSDANPIRLLSPDRDGLVAEHPFTKALYSSAENRIKILVDEERKKEEAAARSVETRDLRRDLDEVGKMAARYLEEKYRELEEQPPGIPTSIPEGLSIIPPNQFPLPFNTTKTFSVYVRAQSPLASGSMVRVVSDNDGICVQKSEVPLTVGEDDPCMGHTTFRLEGRVLGAEGFVSASLNGYQDVVLIEVIEQPEEPPVFDEAVPTGLSFERDSYELVLSKPRKLAVRLCPAPPGLDEARLSLQCDCGDIALHGPVPCLKRPRGKHYLLGHVTVVGRKLHASGSLKAKWREHAAETKLRVVPREANGRAIDPRPVDKDFGTLRAVWNRENPGVLEIGALHPSIRPYLGARQDDYPGKDSREYRMILAEVISEAVAQRILQAKEQRGKLEENMRVDQFYAEHNRLMREFLPRAQRVLVSPALSSQDSSQGDAPLSAPD